MRRGRRHLPLGLCIGLLWAASADAQGTGDVWRAADDALGRAGKAAALELVKDSTEPDIEKLRAYLESNPPAQPELRRAFSKARDLDEAGQLPDVIEALAPLKLKQRTLLEARILDLRAKAYRMLGEFDKALEALRGWEAIAEHLGWLGGREQALHWECTVLLVTLRYAELADAQARSADVAKQLGQPRKMHEALIDRAGLLIGYVGRVREGLEILSVSLEVAEKEGWKDAEAPARDHRAAALRLQGDYAEALDEAERAERLWKALLRPDGQPLRPDGLFNNALLRAIIEMDIGDFEVAEAGLKSVQRMLAEGGVLYQSPAYDYFRPAVKGNLADVAWRRGHHEEAVRLLGECRKEFRALGERADAVAASKDMADVLIDAGRADEALPYLDEVLKEVAADPLARAATLVAQADAYLRSGNLSRAEELLAKALDVEDGERDRPTRNRLYEIQARILLARGEPGDAVAALRKAMDLVDDVVQGLSEEQTYSAREQRARLFQVAIDSAFRSGESDAILEFLERSRGAVLRETICNRQTLQRVGPLDETAKSLQEAAQEVVETRLQLQQALKGTSREVAEKARAALDDAEERLGKLSDRAEREKKVLARFVQTKPETLAGIQELLRPGEAIVYYALPGATGHAFCVTKKGARLVELGDASRIRALCARAASVATGGDLPLRELREALVDRLPLEKDIRTVMVCPDGPLSYLPWPVLFEERYGSTLPSGSTFALLRRQSAAKGGGVLAFAPEYATGPVGEGDVSRGARLVPLLFAEEEVKAITAHGEGNRVLVGKTATEDSAREGLRGDTRWRSVHFACHGIVDPRFPRRSALALAPDASDDGFLTVPEIMALNASTDLVVLSACDSGSGAFVRGEGVVGLARAFLAAGAPRVVASLWRVDDAATKELMVRFYESLADDGEDALDGPHVARALRAAQRKVASDKRWKHPRFWAAWVVWGLPD